MMLQRVGLKTLDGGLQGQFAIESDIKLQGFKRPGARKLSKKFNSQNVSFVLDEKSCTGKYKSQPSTLENKIYQSDDYKFEVLGGEVKPTDPPEYDFPSSPTAERICSDVVTA
ncbi:uncharacterized protein LOC116019718 isoform X2 [Ipomoea triloba]|uniref:uncharacterized protein LOC116019718 isoform X2 n=1 Tax=Ipomoea triloba TaxID=35885 RepID=UPI00125D52FB|nr:uncharacterized protein LOC116019718 isoform X2 [Ipomoea triloba]